MAGQPRDNAADEEKYYRQDYAALQEDDLVTGFYVQDSEKPL